MVLAGGAAAAALLGAALRRRAGGDGHGASAARPDRDSIEASILAEVLVLGGITREDAREFLASELGISGSVVHDIDLRNWAEEYGNRYGTVAAHSLLGTAVKASVMTTAVVSLPQYNALLDLCFRLGLQTDALARLRAQYRFVYIDYARVHRPRSADRIGRSAQTLDRGEMMSLLELEGELSRQKIISAYRRLAAQCHPDRFHEAAPAEQKAGAERFIRLTEAYEALLASCPD